MAGPTSAQWRGVARVVEAKTRSETSAHNRKPRTRRCEATRHRGSCRCPNTRTAKKRVCALALFSHSATVRQSATRETPLLKTFEAPRRRRRLRRRLRRVTGTTTTTTTNGGDSDDDDGDASDDDDDRDTSLSLYIYIYL
jgi:hypothetical protein